MEVHRLKVSLNNSKLTDLTKKKIIKSPIFSLLKIKKNEMEIPLYDARVKAVLKVLYGGSTGGSKWFSGRSRYFTGVSLGGSTLNPHRHSPLTCLAQSPHL